ncbi:MAG: hypothetical protein CL823_06315 [Crocinitomicaceae bacterium]|nr:hypothetical protein [Crocinitomicaceae bacterium]
MELKRYYTLLLPIVITSCNWFNPYDIPLADEKAQCVSYFLPVDSDTSVCFLSNSINIYESQQNESFDFCVKVSTQESVVISCNSMESDTAKVWIETGNLTDLIAGDTVFLEVESPEFGLLTSNTIVPESAVVIDYSLDSRSYFNGVKYFDEIDLKLSDPSNRDEAYMLQLISHIDTIGAPIPSIRNMKSDDQNMLRRNFGDKNLDNALFFSDSFWEGDGTYTFNFRTKSTADEGVPYHYTLIVHSISMDIYKFFYDLEGGDMSGYFNGGGFDIYSNIDGGYGCFGTLKSSNILLFPE